MNPRRKLLLTIGASALSAPIAALAQQPGNPARAATGKIWRVGILAPRSRPAALEGDDYGAFPRGLRESGYVEGKNLVIEWRFADNEVKRMPGLAAELLSLNVDVVITAGENAALAMQKATSTTPIVSAGVSDPVGVGLVKSLARPGGNLTGVSSITGELAPKRLEMLRAIAPRSARVAVLVNPDSPGNLKTLASVQAAAPKVGMTILPAEARSVQDIDNAFTLMRKQGADALLVILNPLFQQQRHEIARLAAQHRLPSMTAARIYTEAGCLISYGSNISEEFRRAGFYVDKIFKGAKPADLPVEQPTRIELVINGKTAQALGLKIPHSLLISADKVIE